MQKQTSLSPPNFAEDQRTWNEMGKKITSAMTGWWTPSLNGYEIAWLITKHHMYMYRYVYV
jgi:hypothetical protein